MPNSHGPLTIEGQKFEDAAILRRLAREAEIVLNRHTFAEPHPSSIHRVPEHLRYAAYLLDGREV